MVCSAVLILGVLVAGGRPQVAAASGQSAATPASAPTIVCQLTNKDTMYSNTYRLSNGQYQAQIFSAPIRFKDAQGTWQSFDTGLVSAGAAGVYRTASTPVAVTIGSTASGSAPARLVGDGYSVTWSPQGLAAGVPTAPGPQTANYLGVATGTSLSYEALDWGVEQSLTLASAAAPASFTCTLSHPGLTLAQTANGSWGLYAPADPSPVFVLSGLRVYDASGAPCGAATMTASPGAGQSSLTYTLPHAWLAAAARRYPVTIDPTLTLNPGAATASYGDTYVGSNGGSHASATSLLCGYDSATASYNRTLVGFDLSCLGHAYVHSASFNLYKSASGGSSPAISTATMNESWSPTATWSSVGCVANSFPTSFCSAPIATQQVAAGAWMSVDATAAVTAWLGGSQANDGFVVYQAEDGSQGAAYESTFTAEDAGGANVPQLVVNYDPAPQAFPMQYHSIYSPGDTAMFYGTANSWYPADTTWIELGFNLSRGDPSTYLGVVGWFRSSALVPSSSWHAVATEADGSVFAYYKDMSNPSDYDPAAISLVGSGCSDSLVAGNGTSPGHISAGFCISFRAAFASQAGVTPDMRFGMGPNSTTTWGSGSCLAGGLPHPPASVGWTAEPGSTFSVITTAVKTLTYTDQASAWFNAGANNNPDNANDQGRGALTLLWPAVSGAKGYHIYLNEGSGNYVQVGATLGNGATAWSSTALGFYPGDTEIANLTQGSAANPFYRATTPSDGCSQTSGCVTPSTLQTTLTPSPAPSPTSSPGCGIVVADGSSGQYIYEHRIFTDGATTAWTKIGTGHNSTLGQNYGTIGPDISTMGGDCQTGFYLKGYLYDAATTAVKANNATLVGVSTSDGTTRNLNLSGGAPLDPTSGAPISANSSALMMASDVDSSGLSHLYSVAYTISTNGSGTWDCDGFRVREYDQNGAYVTDHDVPIIHGTSSDCSYGCWADGNFLYVMMGPNGQNPIHIDKISTASWQIVNQWASDYANRHVLTGCYDQVNNCFWMGARLANLIYQYAGTGNAGYLWNGTQITATNGFDLRDNPNALYTKTAQGSQYANWTAYDFRVVPYQLTNYVSNEVAPANPAAYQVDATLDNRSYTSNVDPVHTTAGLGSWDGNDASARLDLGALQVDATDLSVATYGPSAQVSRTYLASSAQKRFAPGWVYSFDAHLDLSQQGSGIVTYIDAAGDGHQFLASGSNWSAPSGFLGTLAYHSGNSTWTITYTDGTTDTYSSTGVWTSESDRNGNQTIYAWNGNNLTITAANGQTIAVTCNTSGQITKATYTTSAGTREVDYATASPWQVSYYPSTSDARTVQYDYSSGLLSAIDQLNWPGSGQTASEGFSYNSNKLSCVYFPDYNATSKPDARLAISYAASNGTASATITHYGTVGGTANQATEQQTDSWATVTGASAAEESEVQTSANSPECSTTDFNYATNQQLADAVTLVTDSSSQTTQQVSACNPQGDATAQSNDSGVGMQTLAYTDSANPNLPTQITDPLGTTSDSYDSNGNLTSTQRTLNASGDVSCTKYWYNSQGLVNEQKQLVSGSVANGTYAETDYASFYANGSPGTTTVDGVQLALGGSTNNLTETTSYDPFGNLLAQTDWSNSRVSETDTYDIAGNELTSTDAYGITTNSQYDCLGNVTASWRSVSGSSQKDNWTTTTYDAMGRALTVTTKLSDSSGNPTTQDVTTNTWDGADNELTSTSSTMGGQPAAWTYDDQGHATSSWRLGVYSNTAAGRATQDSYDAQGNILSETVPGNSNATTNSYNPDGSLAQQNNPDGSFVAYGYDANGNKTSQTVPMSGYSQNNSNVATTNYAYDYANRLTSTTEPNSFATTNGYDELSRLTGAQGSGNSSATNTAYNNLGWVLQKVDADGVTDSKTYDAHGCVTAETIGSKTTYPMTYNADNQLTAQTDADNNKLTNTYDAFGNLTEAKHTNGSTVLKDVQITPDSLGRPTLRKDTVTGISHSWTYPTNSATGIQETVNYDATPLTKVVVTRNARNMEINRVATIGSSNTVTWAIADPSGRDNADRWTSATLQQTGGTQLSEGRSFDAAGRFSTQSGAGYTSGNSASYAYDPGTGLLAYESLPLLLGGTVSEGTSSTPITYDANQRLATDTVNGVAGSLTFDTLGNLTADTEGATTTNFTYNSANQLTQSVVGANTTVYGWNATNAWRTSQGPSGNPTQIQYSYNAQRRMATYANSATSTTASYTYDAAGQRTKSAVTVSGTTTTTNFAYDGITLMSLSATQGSSSWRVDYLRDEEGTPYGGVYRSPATSTSPTYFTTITNGRGDICELLDANGNAFAAYHYDAWGLPQGAGNYATGIWTQSTSLVGSTLAGQIASRQVLRYASYVYDSESGLYYCNARYYDVGTRQWTTADPVGVDGEESAYQYCDGDSVNRVDPTGEFSYWATIWHHSISASTAYEIAFDIADGTGIATAISACIPDAGPFIAIAVAVSGGTLAWDFNHYAPGGIAIRVQQCKIAPLLRCQFDKHTIITIPG